MSKYLAILTLAACTHSQAFVITGNSIGDMGDSFVETAGQFDAALEAGTITKEEYRDFRDFGTKFQLAFPAAVQLWHVAQLTDDDVMNQRAIALLVDLQGPLVKFALDIAKLVPPLKGPVSK